MQFLRRRFLAFLLLGASTPNLISARTPDTPLPPLKLSVFNYARVPSETLVQAESRASAVFSEAGIEPEWINCAPADPTDFAPSSTPCLDLAWPQHLSVRIVKSGRSIDAETFGQAFLDECGRGVYTNVYYANLASSRDHPELSDSEMLGYVIAHEVGHLLLGTNSHSDSGVMQARWRATALLAAARISLFFTPDQAAALRSRFENASSLIFAGTFHPWREYRENGLNFTRE
jgi:hypothetical protein